MIKHLSEGLIYAVPVYTATDRALIRTLKGEHREGRSLPWLVERLACYYSLNLRDLRRQVGAALELKKHIPLPLNDDLILVPVKTRSQLAGGEATIGYISLLQVERCEAWNGDCRSQGSNNYLSTIFFKSGAALNTLNAVDTLRDKLRQGEAARAYLLKRRSGTTATLGLQIDDIALPDCDCLLLNLFRRTFER